MSTKPDGGPAFPILNVRQDWDDSCQEWDGVHTKVSAAGMSLRDYFAGQALAGLAHDMGAHTRRKYRDGHADGIEAAIAYALADLMLAERSK